MHHSLKRCSTDMSGQDIQPVRDKAWYAAYYFILYVPTESATCG